MNFSELKLFSMMKTKMEFLNQRQDILAQNIANADTPGYQVKDLKKTDFEKLVEKESFRLQMRQTTTAHITPNYRENEFDSEKVKKTYETTPMKNRVSVEEEMMKVAQTKLEYEQTTNLYRKVSDMFKSAIGNA